MKIHTRQMNPCNCGSGAPMCGACNECDDHACRECAITYNEYHITHHKCMGARVARRGIHLMRMAHLFDPHAYQNALNASRWDSDFRPLCKICKISDAPVRLMMWYKSEGWIHPCCVPPDDLFAKWISVWNAY